MLNSEIYNFEEKVIELIRKIVGEIPFIEFGLSFRINKLRVLETKNIDYESEISIDFCDKNGIFDVVECYCYKDGQPIATLDEIEKWLTESFNDVLRRKNRENRG